MSKTIRLQFSQIFFYVGGTFLLISGIAKLVSASGDAPVLQTPDPILAISFQKVFCFVGTFELLISLMCFFGRIAFLQAGLVAWLATNFLLYRLGLLWIGYHKPCVCLGNLTDALHIKPQTADFVMEGILAYLLAGSYIILVRLWMQRRTSGAPQIGGDDCDCDVKHATL